MSEAIRELEELSFRTLPALEQERYDGWVLRWSGGGSRRGNSVNPMASSSQPLDEKVANCEEWFARRGESCVFRLTPLADQGLAALLDSKGYRKTSPTDVMTVEIGDGGRTGAVFDVADVPSAAWLSRAAGEVAPDEAIQRLRSQLMSAPGHKRFMSWQETVGELPQAIAQSVDLDHYTTIYNMWVAEGFRRRNMGSAIVETLLAIGADAGSIQGVLMVTQDNVPAQNLYRKLGFDPAYEYFYMEPQL